MKTKATIITIVSHFNYYYIGKQTGKVASFSMMPQTSPLLHYQEEAICELCNNTAPPVFLSVDNGSTISSAKEELNHTVLLLFSIKGGYIQG